MGWKEKMTAGMQMIADACGENGEWNECKNCPFDKFCTALMNAELVDPFGIIDWNYTPETCE